MTFFNFFLNRENGYSISLLGIILFASGQTVATNFTFSQAWVLLQ